MRDNKMLILAGRSARFVRDETIDTVNYRYMFATIIIIVIVIIIIEAANKEKEVIVSPWAKLRETTSHPRVN